MSPAERAATLDAVDPLAGFRARFVVDDPDLIYLDGNSLGRLPQATVERLRAAVIDEWGGRLVRAWGEGWFDLPRRVGEKIAHVIGARPGEVVVADSTSVNLYKLATAALAARPERKVIVTDEFNFPSDLYVLQACAKAADATLRIASSEDGMTMPPERVEALLDGDVALLALSHTAFKSGYVHDMARLTSAAHDVGALALWDLSHSAGAVPVDLTSAGADLAVGCTYKYLCGGPGSPAYLYVRQEMQAEVRNPICGWFGDASPFAFSLDHRPSEGISAFLTGTPPILSLAAVECGVDLVLEAGMGPIRQKSTALTEFLIERWSESLQPLGVELRSPADASVRGSHVSFGHPDGLAVDRALIEFANVVPDFRAPDSIRFGVAPLSISFGDIAEAIERFRLLLESGDYLRYKDDRAVVT